MDTILTKLQVRRNGESGNKVGVVAAYEDFSTRARVNEFCRGLARDLGQECEIVNQAWLVNLLRLPQLRAIAAHDAASADLIVVSLHDAAGVPEEVRSWIDLWLQEKGNRPKVLLALSDVNYREEVPAMQAWLEGAARRGNMEFVVQSWEATEGRRS
jgi:hypothetical protein